MLKMAAAAIELAELGYRVFPLVPGGKTPLFSKAAGGNGCKDAVSDPNQVRVWWTRYPHANIGLATGQGLTVIDIDEKAGRDGLRHWRELCKQLEINPQTMFARTPTGGYHLYYITHQPIPNSAGRLAEGVDVRGDGGYVVAPPSIRHIGAYRWGKIERMAELPDCLVNMLIRSASVPEHGCSATVNIKVSDRYVRAAIAGCLAEIRAARDGEKHYKLIRNAYKIGQIVGAGWAALTREMAEAMLIAELDRMDNVRSRKSAVKTIQDGLAAGMANPRSAPVHKEKR